VIDGLAIGHHTVGGSGVTVVLLPPGTTGSGEIRGGAPAEREFALLDPRRTVEHVDAVVLAGGSAFGLAAADGVVAHLASAGRGFPTAAGPVPIVPAMGIYDLLEANHRPGAADGAAAAAAATTDAGAWAGGRIGAGAGATVGKWKGREHAVPGGVGIAYGPARTRVSTRIDAARFVAVAVVNALGDVVDTDGRVLAGSTAPAGAEPFPTIAPFEETGANTTLVVVVVDAALDKRQCHALAAGAHDGFARALRPSHTSGDGDATVVLATAARPPDPDAPVPIDRLVHHGAEVTAAAIRAAVGPGVVEWSP
jgi:L-aminopeptidase/D-esterase-like protein